MEGEFYSSEAQNMGIQLCFLIPRLPFAAEADPEGEKDKANVKPEGLVAYVEKIIAELAVWVGKEK